VEERGEGGDGRFSAGEDEVRTLGALRRFDSPRVPPSAKKPTLPKKEVGFCHRLVEAGGTKLTK